MDRSSITCSQFLIILCIQILFSPVLPFVHSVQRSRRETLHHNTLWAGKPTSAASEERREEDKRRKERSGDVVIGKTSAKQGETDYALNIAATEGEWLRQASGVEQKIYHETEKGMEHLKMLDLENADEAFSRVFDMKPDAYLWQAGIVKFYLGEVEAAADLFARSAQIYERRFLDPATEERIWRHACEVKLISGLRKSDRKVVRTNGIPGVTLTEIPETDQEDAFLGTEVRKVFRTARELFESTIEDDHSKTILSRAKLRSMGGALEEAPKLDVKRWKLNSWYYLGLHYDALGDEEESKKCMKMALRLSPTTRGSDLIHTLPTLHMAARDWFDDDEYIPTETSTKRPRPNDETRTHNRGSGTTTDPVVIESIRSSVEKLRLADLQAALKIRGVRSIGSKDELRERLFESLLSDSGLM